MVITREIIEKGMSVNGGWSFKQIELLTGYPAPINGWLKRLIGKEMDDSIIQEFLSLKDIHLNKKDPRAKSGSKRERRAKKRHLLSALDMLKGITFEPANRNMSYKDQYLHPNWQKYRLAIFNRDSFTCTKCFSKDKTLHAHHLKYCSGFIWEVDAWDIVTLCEDCHSHTHNKDLRLNTNKTEK